MIILYGSICHWYVSLYTAKLRFYRTTCSAYRSIIRQYFHYCNIIRNIYNLFTYSWCTQLCKNSLEIIYFSTHCIMKIFSNFDTNSKRIAVGKCIEEYGSDNTLVIQRSRLFVWLYVRIPTIVYTTISALIIYTAWVWSSMTVINRFVVIIVALSWFALMMPVTKKYIDYKLDFGIFTPKWLFLYNQTGILNRNMKSLNVQNIRSIVVEQSGLLYSLCNNGNIFILSEWSEVDFGEARMRYVHDPEAKRERIKQIFSRSQITNY